MLRVEATQGTREILKLLKMWPARTRKVRAQFVRLAAQWAYEDLVGRIPTKAAYKAYREGLQVSEVSGLSDGEAAYAVHISPREARVRKVDAVEVLLYVRPRRGSRRTPDAVLVLERFSPWTASTLPYRPSRRDAKMISQRVGKKVVGRVEANRRRDRSEWEPLLRKAGQRRIRRERDTAPARGLRALPAAALDAARLEFGLGGGDSKAHWRPMLASLQRGGVKAILRSNEVLRRSLVDPSFGGWRGWPDAAPRSIGVGEATKLVAFQDKLGVKVQP